MKKKTKGEKERKFMSENERTARKLLDVAIGSSHYALVEFYEIPLTDEECRNIAKEYPYSLKEIRKLFPTPKYFKRR